MTAPALLLAALLGLAQTPESNPATGVLVMAHGGSDEWNASVSASIEGLRGKVPTALAFGMADPHTLEAALDSLADQGVERVAVVRAFISGSSFLDQTLYLLGLSPTPPERFLIHRPEGDPGAPAAHGGHGGHPGHEDPQPIQHGLVLATHPAGIAQHPGVARILTDRAHEISESPSEEAVLVLAHGMGDDGENDAVLAAMEDAAQVLRAEGYGAVQVATLLEDWPEKRAQAEAEIRAFTEAHTAEGRRVLVVPYRLSGFGPYSEVLEGLEYVPGGGMVPHGEISRWIEATASEVMCRQGWENPLSTCEGEDPRTGRPSPSP
jgi:sirohydrochlorin ferrochelatase